MLKSILKRIFYMLIVVWVVSVMAFILMRCAPGDPTATMLPDTASEEQRAALYEQLGLNQPYIIQYLKYMGGLFTGNLGHSTLYNSPVREVIAQRLPATICVSLISAVFVLLISVPIGIISGVTRGSMADFSLMFFVVILQSMSVVWVCVLLLLIFVVKLDILPSMGYYGLSRPAYPEISEQYHDARVMYMNDGIVLEIQQMAEETGCPIDETTLEPLVYKTYLDALSRKGMEVFRARRELARAGREMGRFFQSYDLLISPTCGRIGRPLGTLNGVVNSEISASEWARKRRDYACIAPLANVAGLPSISLPLYMSDSGLPIGVEIDGAIDQDELVLQLSAQLERAAPWSERKPPIYVSEI